MKILIPILFFLNLNHIAVSQAPAIQWQKCLGGSGAEAAKSIQQLSNGSYIIAGYTSSDDGDVSAFHGTHDYWVVNFSEKGGLVWQKCLGGSSLDVADNIEITADSGFIVAGHSFSGDGDLTDGLDGFMGKWIVKLNNNAEILWKKKIAVFFNGNVYWYEASNIIKNTSDGGYIITTFYGEDGLSEYDDINSCANEQGYNYLVVKTDAAGNIQWQKCLGGSDSDEPFDIQQTHDGGYIVAGITYSNDGDVIGNHGHSDSWVVKLDALGEVQWSKCFGGSGYDTPRSIQQTSDGGFIATGSTNSNDGDFISNHGKSDLWVIKIDGAGNLQWQKCFGGSSEDIGYSIQQTKDEGFIVAGATNSIDGDVSGLHESVGNRDVWAIKLNNTGSIQWQKCLGGTGLDEAYSVLQTRDGGYIIAGHTDSKDGDVLGNHGNRDWWIVKLAPENTLIVPELILSQSILQTGQGLTITGQGFPAKIYLNITTPLGDTLPTYEAINYFSGGRFNFNLIVSNDLVAGEYLVYARDESSGQSTARQKFLVKKENTTNLWISKPVKDDIFPVNQPLQLFWGDFGGKGTPVKKSGYIEKIYSIDVSTNDGLDWYKVNYGHTVYAIPGTNNSNYNISYTPPIPGNYRLRVVETGNANNTAISETFSVVGPAAEAGFTHALEWDESCPKPEKMPHPIGLTADGTSRLFIRLLKNNDNPKAVKSINAVIKPTGVDNSSGPELLGKLKFVSSTVYNLDDNNLTNTSASQDYNPDAAKKEYLICLVAPNDFTHDLKSQAPNRTIKVDFTITFSDNTTANYSTYPSSIQIVRPPLFLVHGLNGAASSFEETRYKVTNGYKYFDGGLQKNGVWQEVQRVSLYPEASFNKNAELVLGINYTSDKYNNTFPAFIENMRNNGYACNKVDWVCHSMGGCVGRTIINDYPEYLNGVSIYNPDYPDGVKSYRSYGTGFINKFITIATPHNGSPVADFITDVFPKLTAATGDAFLNYSAINFFIERNYDDNKGYFVLDRKSWLGPIYKLSPAISDLKSGDGGKKFKVTTVKNHLIGGDIVKTDIGITSKELESDFNSNKMISLLKILTPKKAKDIINDINDIMAQTYNTINFLANSDLIVPLASQFPNLNSNSIPVLGNENEAFHASIGYGLPKNHLSIKKDDDVGTKVMELLNSPINSPNFADEMAANNENLKKKTGHTQQNEASYYDSIHTYIDTNFVCIVSPGNDSLFKIGQSINVRLFIKDTVGLLKTQLIFQGKYYESFQINDKLDFLLTVAPENIGKNYISATSMYDSAGFTIYHTDTVRIDIQPEGYVSGLYVLPTSFSINPHQAFIPTINVAFYNYIATIESPTDSLQILIADTNVVVYDSLLQKIVSKDTGSTYVVFNYKGFSDTIFVRLTKPEQPFQVVCPQITDCSPNLKIIGEGGIISGDVHKMRCSGDLVILSCELNDYDCPDVKYNWYENDSLLGTERDLYVKKPGSYRVEVIIANRCDASAQYDVYPYLKEYTFTGNGDWENPENWENSEIPPSTAEFCDTIIIDPITDGECVLSSSQTLSNGATMVVRPGRRFRIVGELIQK